LQALVFRARATYPAAVRIYTRTGDDGTTGLLGPGRVRKSDARVEAYGSVDELNAMLGVVRAIDTAGWLASELVPIQTMLFSVGAELAATTPEALAKLEPVGDAEVAQLEALIDRLEAELPALTNFILPGGSALSAQLHLARTVCRRAERRVVALSASASVAPGIVRLLNRLADLLFVMARWCERRAGVAEVEWRPRGSRT